MNNEKETNTKKYIVEKKYNNWPISKWAKYNISVSFTTLAQYARKKLIKINGKKADLKTILYENDIIEIANSLDHPIPTRIIDLAPIKDMIIYENEDFVIIEKPIGITMQGQENSIAQQTNLYIVHRLDKTTSGLAVLAKNKETASNLSSQIQNGTLKKKYLAIIENPLNQQSGIWAQNIDDKQAKTEYRILESNEKYALAELILHTGRKHQIRKHAAMNNMPILGDKEYGNYDNEQRIHLHSYEIEFLDNTNGQKIIFRSKNKLILPKNEHNICLCNTIQLNP